jgi:hypothetical protein
VDFDFWGNQISAHVSDASSDVATNPVDGDHVPVRHFGAILDWDEHAALALRLRAAGVRFRIERRVRFAGRAGEQATMFLDDPSGNVLEFKAFRDEADIFATELPGGDDA